MTKLQANLMKLNRTIVTKEEAEKIKNAKCVYFAQDRGISVTHLPKLLNEVMVTFNDNEAIRIYVEQ